MVIKNVLIVHKLGYSGKEKKTIHIVREFLQKNNILVRVISPLELHSEIVKGRDLVVIIGGDGTFLKTAQYVLDQTPFLCINANVETTEGYFSKTNINTMPQKINQIIQERGKQMKLMRLSAAIAGKAIEPSINEYYIGQRKPYDVAKYMLKVRKKIEQQKSSGVLVSTPAGSTAWARGAGGKILSLKSRKFQFVVREPYKGKLTKTTIRNGILNPTEKITIIPESEGMIVVADALGREHHLKKNQKVEITMSKTPIYIFY